MNWLNKLYCSLTKKGHKYSIYTHHCVRCGTVDYKYAHVYYEN